MILEIWDSLRDSIPAKDRLDAADNFIGVIDSYGMAEELRHSGLTFDKEIGAALVTHLGMDEDEEDEGHE